MIGGTEMKHLGDITKINGAEIEIVDVITGGSPCQDLSIAGKRAGLAGARSGLFMEQVRIAKEMREEDRKNGRTGELIRPRYLVWENVPGAFSSNKGRDFAAVLEEIIRIVEPEAAGIDAPAKGWPTWGGYHDCMGGRWSVAWRVHDAQYWGVPQRRRRISLVADFGGDTAGEILFDRKSVPGDPTESGTAGEGLAEAAKAGFDPAVARSLTARADGSTCADRGPNIVCSPHQGGCDGGGKGALAQDEKSGTLGTGNDQTIFAAIPINDKATRWQGGGESRNHDGSGNGLGIGKEGDPCPTLTAGDRHGVMAVVLDMTHACDVIRECGEQVPALQARMGAGGNQVPLTYGIGNGQAHEASIMTEEVSQTLNTMHDAQAILYQPKSAMEENWAASETKNALRAGESKVSHVVVCEDVSPALRAKANDPYREDMTAYIASVDCRNFCEGGEINGTLQAKESGGQSLNLNNTVRQNMVVRRLTPLECERLQGFPDGWTDIGEWVDSKGKRHKDADSPRYKALGNSIALPFWEWMLRRMARYLAEGATLGSLFDGIGGFPLIWERIHGEGTARWASEIEEFPIAVTKLRFWED